MIGDELEIFTYEYLLKLALADVSDSFDKRQGSIIFDTLSPFCYRLADIIMNIRRIYINTYAETASGEYLDMRVHEQGIIRYPASYAVQLGYFEDASGNPMQIPIGSRFNTISDTSPITYAVTAAYTVNGAVQPGYYECTCEKSGTIGNEYVGGLINITFIPGLTVAQMSTLLVPARDVETDEELRSRYFNTIEQKAFGGNIADYNATVRNITGIGAVQIYPVWNGGGTVKLSIIDAEYNVCTPEFVASVQEEIDPENSTGQTGQGLGLAPIDHQVTVVTPTEVVVPIVADIYLVPGFTLGQVQAPCELALEGYFLSLRQQWGDGDEFNNYFTSIFRSRIAATLLTVNGIANVSTVTINGVNADLSMTESAITQQLPSMGTVTLNVVG